MAKRQAINGGGIVVEAYDRDPIWEEEWLEDDVVTESIRDDGKRTMSLNREDIDEFKQTDEATEVALGRYLEMKEKESWDETPLMEKAKDEISGELEGDCVDNETPQMEEAKDEISAALKEKSMWRTRAITWGQVR